MAIIDLSLATKMFEEGADRPPMPGERQNLRDLTTAIGWITGPTDMTELWMEYVFSGTTNKGRMI